MVETCLGRGANSLAESRRIMNQLVLLLITGAAFFVLFLALLLAGRPRVNPDDLPLAELERIVPLNGLVFNQAEVLLNPNDYRMLQSHRELRRVARELRRDRRNIVLLWLRLLQEDILNLWRFRRLLIRSGVPTGIAEEFRIGMGSILVLAFLLVLRIVVTVGGPFAFAQLTRFARQQVEGIYEICAGILIRVPQGTLAGIESQWAASSGMAVRLTSSTERTRPRRS